MRTLRHQYVKIICRGAHIVRRDHCAHWAVWGTLFEYDVPRTQQSAVDYCRHVPYNGWHIDVRETRFEQVPSHPGTAG